MLQQVRAGLGNRGGCPILPPPFHPSGTAQPASPAQTWWDTPRAWKPPQDPLPGVTRGHHPPWPGPLSGAHICFSHLAPSLPALHSSRSLLPLSSSCRSNSEIRGTWIPVPISAIEQVSPFSPCPSLLIHKMGTVIGFFARLSWRFHETRQHM